MFSVSFWTFSIVKYGRTFISVLLIHRNKKKLINCIIKKRKIFGGGSNWPIFCCADFLRNVQKWLRKLNFKLATPKKMKLKMCQFESPLKIFLFLKVKFINFFLIPVAQMYQNESAPIFYYAKSKKYCLKLLKIAVLQPPDWIQRKKTPCIYVNSSGPPCHQCPKFLWPSSVF